MMARPPLDDAGASYTMLGMDKAREMYGGQIDPGEEIKAHIEAVKRADEQYSGVADFQRGEKPTNPKDIIGSDKLPLHLWPSTATAMGCLGLLEGALKYGRSNFRAIGVRSSIYIDACMRHLFAWFEGEDNARDSGLPHMAHALACLAIIVDAQAAGKLNDDRMYPGGYDKLREELTPHVARLRALYADKNPQHYTKP